MTGSSKREIFFNKQSSVKGAVLNTVLMYGVKIFTMTA